MAEFGDDGKVSRPDTRGAGDPSSVASSAPDSPSAPAPSPGAPPKQPPGTRSQPLFLEKEDYRRKRAMDAGYLLPLFGAILFLLPVLFAPAEHATTKTSGGYLYLFAAWILLTGCAWRLGNLLKDPDPESDRGTRPEGAPSTSHGDSGVSDAPHEG